MTESATPTSTAAAVLRHPVAFGTWLIRGERLRAHTPRRTIEVRAPGRLLSRIAELCDGRRSWLEVVDELAAVWSGAQVENLMVALATKSVLIESAHLLSHWTDVGQLPLAFPRIAARPDFPALAAVAAGRLLPGKGAWSKDLETGVNPLAGLLLERRSALTFDDRPVSAAVLLSVLWAAHGVTGSDEAAWHRTVASGGNMQSSRWLVAILRDLPGEDGDATVFERGLYEARFHQRGGASLRGCEGAVDDCWHTLIDPRVLQFASAIVYPIFDTGTPAERYGNRATMFASIECGQSLQNAQLMATALGCASVVRGDADASRVLALFGVAVTPGSSEFWLAFPALVLGARATPMQVAQQRSDDWLQVRPNLQALHPEREQLIDGPKGTQSFAYAAMPAGNGMRDLSSSGRAASPTLALVKAEAEIWERIAWSTPGELGRGTIADIDDAIDPRRLVSYSARQYADPRFPHHSFSDRRNYHWRRGVEYRGGKAVSILADCVYAWSSLPARYRRHSYTNATTSGVAAHTDPEQAIRRAALELIERDAFAAAWIRGKAPTVIEAASLPRSQSERIGRLALAGFDVQVLWLEDSLVPVPAVLVRRNRPAFLAVTASCELDIEAALSKALDEAEGRTAYCEADRQLPDVRTARDVISIDHINAYFSKPRHVRHADFLVTGSVKRTFGSVARDACTRWADVERIINKKRMSLLCVDLSPSTAAVHQGRKPLSVMRAFIPGLLPIWFEFGSQPAGMTRFTDLVDATPDSLQSGSSARFLHPFT